ncbi:MAG: hypothetical protein EP344_13230 [Bacteroidetes bacterium]|nr:MAG: hypothetical protein EP344_13230 [Bacteroidota bacterium]
METNSTSIALPLSKQKLTLVFLGGIIMTGLAGWMAYAPGPLRSELFTSENFIRGVGITGAVFFGLSTLYLLRKLADDRPGLIIDAAGITDNTSGVSVGLIKWGDITGMRQQRIGSTYFIMIDVADPEKYTARAGSVIKMGMEANHKLYGSPLAINANALQYDKTELAALLESEWQRRRGE